LLVAHALEPAIGEGMRGFDVLRGREDYKYEWGRAIGRPGDGV